MVTHFGRTGALVSMERVDLSRTFSPRPDVSDVGCTCNGRKQTGRRGPYTDRKVWRPGGCVRSVWIGG